MAPLTADEQTAAMQAASSDLFLMDRQGVPIEIQGKVFHAGVTSVAQFWALFCDVDNVRKMLREELDVPQNSLASKVVASNVVVVWQRAKARSDKLAELEGQCKLRREPKPLPATDFQAMKAAFEARFWEVPSSAVPARAHFEKVQEMVEKNDLRAEALTDVLHVDDVEPGIMVAKWDADGVIKAIKPSSSVPLPRDPEELRSRLEVLGNAWQFVAFQQPHCAYLQRWPPAKRIKMHACQPALKLLQW